MTRFHARVITITKQNEIKEFSNNFLKYRFQLHKALNCISIIINHIKMSDRMFITNTEPSDLTILGDTIIEAPLQERKRLNLIKKIKLKLFGKVYVGDIQLSGWKSSQPFYAFKCPVHGINYNYPSGWKKVLKCPKCLSDYKK